jgi:prepilin-type N-terminal cleavage/methylation domain-containing protein
MHSLLLRRRSQSTQAGFTLVETIVATAVSLLGLTAAMLLNTAHLRMVKSARQSNAATLCLQERVEQMRLGDWRKITDATYLCDALLANPALSAAPLDQTSEHITISAYPDPDAAQQLLVERRASGDRVVLISGNGLTSQRLAQVEFKITWTGGDGRRRQRATTMISNGGISRMNLPGFGTTGGTTTATPTPAPAPTDDSEASPTPAPAPTPVPSTSHGNGGGRGTVGGKSGKK